MLLPGGWVVFEALQCFACVVLHVDVDVSLVVVPVKV